MTTGSNSFSWFDKAGEFLGANGAQTTHIMQEWTKPFPSSSVQPMKQDTCTSKVFKLENILIDSLTGVGVSSSVVSLVTFENNKTDTFNIDKEYFLDMCNINSFILCMDNSVLYPNLLHDLGVGYRLSRMPERALRLGRFQSRSTF